MQHETFKVKTENRGKNTGGLLINTVREEKLFHGGDMPPCPNGCGNEASRKIHKADLKQLGENKFEPLARSSGMHVDFYLCKHCGEIYYIKIQKLGQQEETGPGLHAA